MMNLCPKYTRKEMLKLYPTVTKSEIREFTKLGEKHGKTLPNHLKCPNEDATKHSPKKIAPPKNHK
jgi:hypothetical protein